ncbi:hypothetical protein GE061_015743 [Apolygus lucorum]|uniref:Regulatory protein zeste n=1 Tax=Apolygus lucorum TaxID=248454 RepID=A0A8S9XP35_APOLU|nr:hypothetical protein GE061_015743 [Apolygus lucorum]
MSRVPLLGGHFLSELPSAPVSTEKKVGRVNFGEEERRRLRELILEYREQVETKKSDVVSTLEKKRAWEEVSRRFNSTGEFPKRTTVQLRKLWENIKFRKKAFLNEEKREPKTGGESVSQVITPDPECYSMGVDAVLHNAADVSQEAGTSGDIVMPQEVILDEDDLPAPLIGMAFETSPVQSGKGLTKNGGARVLDKVAVRIRQNNELASQARELHQRKMKEQEQKILLVQKQIDLVEKQLENEKRNDERAQKLHELQIAKCQLEINRLKEESK